VLLVEVAVVHHAASAVEEHRVVEAVLQAVEVVSAEEAVVVVAVASAVAEDSVGVEAEVRREVGEEDTRWSMKIRYWDTGVWRFKEEELMVSIATCCVRRG
jgi:hypothetical protein